MTTPIVLTALALAVAALAVVVTTAATPSSAATTAPTTPAPQLPFALLNFTVFTPAVDAALRVVPDPVWDTLAGVVGIPVGVLLAFAGARFAKSAAFVFGAAGGGLLGAVVMAFVGPAPSDVWFGVVLGLAAAGALLACTLLGIAKILMVVAVGASVSAVLVQYVFSTAGIPTWAIYLILALCIILSAILAWKTYKLALIIASSVVGGFIVLLCIGRLARGPISLLGMLGNAQFLAACVDMTCWGPFIGGFLIGGLGFLYQLRRELPRGSRTRTKRDKKAERRAAEAAKREERERFEKRVEEMRRKAEERVAAETAAARAEAERARKERDAVAARVRELEAQRQALLQQQKQQKQSVPARPPRRMMPRPSQDAQAPQVAEAIAVVDEDADAAVAVADPSETLQGAATTAEDIEASRAEMERRNAELAEQLAKAEAAAAAAQAQARAAQKTAMEEYLRSEELERELAAEREELEKRLEEARQAERAAVLKKQSVLSMASLGSGGTADDDNNNNNAGGASSPRDGKAGATIAAAGGASTGAAASAVGGGLTEIELEEEVARAEVERAEAQGRTQQIEFEIQQLGKPELLVASSAPVAIASASAGENADPNAPAGNDAEFEEDEDQREPPRTLTFEEQWRNVSVAMGVPGIVATSVAASPKAASAGAAAPAAREVDSEAVPPAAAAQAPPQQPPPPPQEQDPFMQCLYAMDRGLVLALQGLAFLIAMLYWASGKCADAARDAYAEQQEADARRREAQQASASASAGGGGGGQHVSRGAASRPPSSTSRPARFSAAEFKEALKGPAAP